MVFGLYSFIQVESSISLKLSKGPPMFLLTVLCFLALNIVVIIHMQLVLSIQSHSYLIFLDRPKCVNSSYIHNLFFSFLSSSAFFFSFLFFITLFEVGLLENLNSELIIF